MSSTLSRTASTLPWLVRRSTVLTWGALPAAVTAGLVGALGLVPAVVAVAVGQPVLAAGATLVPALLLTGSARFAAALVRGDRARARDAVRVDPALGVLLAVPAAAAVLLVAADGPARLAGDLLAAATALAWPFVAGYAAVRGRSGLAAWRGGLVLIAYRPGWALTLVALSVIGAVAVVATAGVLVVVVPPFLTLLGTAMCALLLDEIDAQQDR